jgi:hypothetical protein
MPTATCESRVSDLELLHDFIGESLQNGGRLKTVDELLGEFREYLSEVERLREEIRPALERSLRGESKPIDWEALKRRGRERLAKKGITD